MKIIKNEVIGIDEQTGMVLKKMITDKGEYLNRKLAVPNTIYICEKGRAKLNKSQIDSPFQTYHLKWNKNEEEWELLGLKKVRQHAKKNNRLFIPFNQRSQDLWASLNWNIAFEDFRDLLRKTDIVPFNLPLTASLEEWEMYKAEALKLLTENQILIPIISTKHDIRHFPNIVKQELTSSKLLGLSCYELTEVELKNYTGWNVFLDTISSQIPKTK